MGSQLVSTLAAPHLINCAATVKLSPPLSETKQGCISAQESQNCGLLINLEPL
jgi:hypothetical protein